MTQVERTANGQSAQQKQQGPWHKGAARPLIVFVLALALWGILWQLVAATFFSPYLLPTPSSVAVSLWSTIESGELPAMIWMSFIRIMIGFFLGAMVGVLLGLAMGSSDTISGLFDPVIELLRPISTVAIIPIALVWFGIGESPKYFIVAYGVFFITVLNTVAGVRQTPLVRKRAAMCLGAKGWRLFFLIVLPSAVPYVMTGLRVALGSAFTSIIAAEMIAANEGIGYFIMQARLLVQTQRIFVGLAALGLMGFAADRLFRLLSHVLLGKYVRVAR